MPRTQNKPVAAAPRSANLAQRRKLVEEFARLDEEVESFKPRLLRHEKIRQLILEWHRNLDPDEEALEAGNSCDILISSRDRVRTVTLAGKKSLFKLWGQQNFIARAHVLLKSLPDPKDELSLYTIQASIGPRHLHVMRRDKSAAGSAA